MTTHDTTVRPTSSDASWRGVWAIAFGAFSLVVTEFLPVGVLPEMSATLGISEGTGGLAITATALLGAVAAPAATLLIREIDRRQVLLGLTMLLIVSSALTIVAQSLIVLIIARVILGLAVGGFWAVALAAVERLVPPARAHTATAIVLGGISVGSVVSVPAGSLIASHADWHTAFAASSVLAVVVLVVQMLLVPQIPATHAVRLSDFGGLFRSPRIVAILAIVVAVVSGHYVAYTFISPYLQQITGITGSGLLGVLLLGFGLFTVVGNFVGGALVGHRAGQTVVATNLVLAAALVAIAIWGGHASVAVSALAVWALAWGAAPIGTQVWLFAAARNDHSIEAAQAINTSLFQLSIGLGSLVGSVAVNTRGIHSATWIASGVLVVAIAASLLAASQARRPTSGVARGGLAA
jgi:predicted MFS family arabinose efflux permease